MKTLNLPGPSLAFGNRFKAQVVERRPGHPDEGKVVYETALAPNLILENGMNNVATMAICDLFKYCAIGYSSTPTEEDQGAILGTTSGLTLTVTGGTPFVEADEGALVRFDTGEMSVITDYVSSTEMTLRKVLGVSSGTEFSLHRVEQTGLFNEQKRSGTYLTGAPNCQTTLSSSTFTHTRTFEFTVEVGNVSYYEVGFSHSPTPGQNCNTRGLFSANPVTLVAGQQLRVIYYFLETVAPTSPRDAEVVISGWPALEHPLAADPDTDFFTLVAHGFENGTQVFFDGALEPTGITFNQNYFIVNKTPDTFQVEATLGGGAVLFSTTGSGVILFTNTKGTEQCIGAPYSTVRASDGATTSWNGSLPIGDPYYVKTMLASEVATAHEAWPKANPTGSFSGPTGHNKSMSSSYDQGSYRMLWFQTYATNECNSSQLRRFAVGDGTTQNSGFWASHLIYLFDHKQEKGNTFTLKVQWAYTWERDFS